jgi:malic enzyme
MDMGIEDIVVCDSHGIIDKKKKCLNETKKKLASITIKRTCPENLLRLGRAEIFLSWVSSEGHLHRKW